MIRRERQRARSAESRRRARLCLSQLRWLEGFAADGRWYVVGGGPPAGAVLDSVALSQARRTVNRLSRDHSDVLRELVGDVEGWYATIDGVLASLGAQARRRTCSHEIGDLAPPRVRRAAHALEAANPALRSLIRAATSAWVLRRDVLGPAIAWIEARAQTLTRLVDGAEPIGLRRMLELAQIGLSNQAGVDAVLALMRLNFPDPQQTAERLDSLIGGLKGDGTTVAPVPHRSTVMAIAWVDSLRQRTPGERDRALTLLAAVDLVAALEPWRAWEAAHGARIERALAFASGGIERGPTMEQVRQIIAGLGRAKAALPRSMRLGEVLASASLLAQDGREPFLKAIVRLLGSLPPRLEGRERALFLNHAAEVAEAADQDHRAAWLWEATARELTGGASERMLGPWTEVFAGGRRSWIERDILSHAHRRAEVQRLAAALARLACELHVAPEHAQRLDCALASGLAENEAVALVHRLDTLDIELSVPLVRAAVSLAGRDTQARVDMLRLLNSITGVLDRSQERALADLCEYAATAGNAWLMRGLLHHDRQRVIELSELAALVPRRGWPKLERDGARPVWIKKYPPSLADALTRLAWADPHAQEAARRRLAADLPDRATLEREAVTLRSRGPLGEREARRLQNLEARISAPRLPTQMRLGRLAAKIDLAAVRIGGAKLAAALAEEGQARVLTALALRAWPGRAGDRLQRSVLAAVVRLDAPHRALAGRLLRAREGPPPWDLRDDPVNQGFLARVSRVGLDMSAWLDDTPRAVIAGDGEPMELGLCGDPLEVFAMGTYFNTCLAPDGGNFFSVVTNAADVNKRVLYGRRADKVVGRCLLALTDDGRILTFHPYAHDKRLGFDALVRTFATELAGRMRTDLAVFGRVSCLLGHDWYDDGAQDLVGQYQALAQPAFAAAVQKVAPSKLVPLLEVTLGRPLDDVTLPVVLAASVLTERPELIEPLAPYLLARPTLPDETLRVAAALADRHGDQALADRLLAAPAARSDLRRGAWYLGQVLARMRPSFALVRLRETRPRGIRGWQDESGERLAVAALAFETLRRPRQAAALYRRAIADEPELAYELRPRLAALEGTATGP